MGGVDFLHLRKNSEKTTHDYGLSHLRKVNQILMEFFLKKKLVECVDFHHLRRINEKKVMILKTSQSEIVMC